MAWEKGVAQGSLRSREVAGGKASGSGVAGFGVHGGKYAISGGRCKESASGRLLWGAGGEQRVAVSRWETRIATFATFGVAGLGGGNSGDGCGHR